MRELRPAGAGAHPRVWAPEGPLPAWPRGKGAFTPAIRSGSLALRAEKSCHCDSIHLLLGGGGGAAAGAHPCRRDQGLRPLKLCSLPQSRGFSGTRSVDRGPVGASKVSAPLPRPTVCPRSRAIPRLLYCPIESQEIRGAPIVRKRKFLSPENSAPLLPIFPISAWAVQPAAGSHEGPGP